MLIRGDARWIPLADESVQTVITSPPYWGLRDYGLEPSVWPTSTAEGAEAAEHEHDFEDRTKRSGGAYAPGSKKRWQHSAEDFTRDDRFLDGHPAIPAGSLCAKCGAWRGMLGLEPTPELYVQHIVEVFREVRRVLRKDGTVWLNLGDSYNGAGRETHGTRIGEKQGTNRASAEGLDKCRPSAVNLKPKDLVGIPWRVAFALQAPWLTCSGCGVENHATGWATFANGRRICPACEKSKGAFVSEMGWWLRSDIIWAKPNPIPESVTDRPTKAHEYIFLLTKSERYYFDQDAVREPSKELEDPRSQRDRHGTHAVPPGQTAHRGIVGARDGAYSWPKGWDASKGEGGHGTFHRLGREGINSRMHQDRDPQHPQERKARSGNKQRRIADGKDRMRLNSHLGSSVPWEGTTRNIRSVWDIATQPYSGAHFATFPEEIPDRCIRAGSRPGDLVLDPFGGSGTVGRVAERLNRRWVCMDLKYQELAEQRTVEVQKELLEIADQPEAS